MANGQRYDAAWRQVAVKGAQTLPARPWGPADRTGGPVDGLFDELRECIHGLMVERLEVTHAADDDNVWFLRATRGAVEVQIDTWPHGQTPFYIEADQGPVRTSDTAEAVALIRTWLEPQHPD